MFWRIATGVFVSILCIEALLLVYSWFGERERVIHLLDDTLEVFEFSLDRHDPVPQLERLRKSAKDEFEYTAAGYVALSPGGSRVLAGTVGDIVATLSTDKPEWYDSSNAVYMKYVELAPPGQTQVGWKIWINMDASSVDTYLTSYVYRIIGMILLISLFVTGAALFYLRPVLIAPLLRLDRLLVKGQRAGIQNAIVNERDLARPDELGRVFRSFDDLRHKLLQSEKGKQRIAERFEQFANLGADCFWEIDQRGRLTFLSGDSKAFFHSADHSLIGSYLPSICKQLRDRIPDIDALPEAIRTEGVWTGTAFRADGDTQAEDVHFEVMGAPFYSEDSRHLAGFRGTVKDVTKETVLSNELSFFASHDELTGLRNRRELSQALEDAVDAHAQAGTHAALAVLDLDRFKHVNDNAGHAAGDALLCVIADIFRSHAAEHNLFRLGGDEFAILFQGQDAAEALSTLESIREDIQNYHFHWSNMVFNVSVTAGLAELSEDMDSAAKLVLAADSCCIDAKRDGKNTILVFNAADSQSLLAQSENIWTSRILNAIDNNEFELFQQSIKHINSLDRDTFEDNEEHFEILIRMRDGEGGYWPPNEFLPAAERFDLMPKIDKWVVENAMHWLAQQDLRDRPNFLMNINLSAASLASSSFHHYLLDSARKHQALNVYVCFEITESAAIINLDKTVGLLAALRDLGCRVALDDFGTGFSSLSHIRQLPLDYIKIDGTFIQHITRSNLDQTLVKSVSNIAKVLQIKTVAEFVDTPEALDVLDALDIDYAQGFLFSRPEKLVDESSESVSKAA